jgi:hypothetical protein
MRTTIDLPSDLHSVLASLARSNRSSMSQTAVALVRRGLQVPVHDTAGGPLVPAVSTVTGLPLVPLSRAISGQDVRALEDQA